MDNNQDTWFNRKWRPAMGWTYMVICILDFAVFPILWSILQAYQNGNVNSQWDPLTLRGAGLFHMAMGAIVGVTAWSRGQEKINATVSTGSATALGLSATNQFKGNTSPAATINTNSELDPQFRNTRND